MNVMEEEMRIREKLAREIETELEREIMEGILLLVRRLSILRAKQINRALEDLNLDQYLSEICNSCNLCNADVGDNVSRWHSRVQSPASEKPRVLPMTLPENGYIKKCSEMES
ncbi:hypothetical protein D5086_026608 [Populus alba]|uniref:Uncharacterized protein n=1 Tax=Populus alba TaxID=43335 RepID=A0ACC4B2U4_POPAL